MYNLYVPEYDILLYNLYEASTQAPSNDLLSILRETVKGLRTGRAEKDERTQVVTPPLREVVALADSAEHRQVENERDDLGATVKSTGDDVVVCEASSEHWVF